MRLSERYSVAYDETQRCPFCSKLFSTYRERFEVGDAIGVLIANDLTGGDFKYHDEYEQIVARLIGTLARRVEYLTKALRMMEEGQTRRDMFGALMRILGQAVQETL